MVTKELKNIFLSASIPFKERHEKYYNTADIIAIRDSVIALASLVIPKYRLIWGGHPSITPIIYHVLEKYEIDIQSHVKLYQSKYFEKIFPIENKEFETVVITDDLGELKPSLRLMREKMLGENTFEAGIFIGGMDGIEDEYSLFRELNPKSIILPIASTGAAAKIIYDNNVDEFKNEKLINDYGYMSLFQELLIDKLN
ncbi:hypothetical protein [Sphingobacterium athyrii]|uniref:Uncharacterized protein n=1 Tax=Sphingobacterium athyrii TaxID=2152717 RepID=A0A363NTL9_9SPHI|nr:hypothetical protein [Sphingobacterium athyrii]PUV24162.1 hypothetical protein DCO56_12410 [Sphingobacterium athyrii]